MENRFMDAYIHLEKICNEIYGTNHGISKYIEDMEDTTQALQRDIPQWDSTYKKLKNIRWKRNQFVHEGNVEYDDLDEVWLREFYQQIMNTDDPLSIKHRMQQEVKSYVSSNKTNNNVVYMIENRTNKEDEDTRIDFTLTVVIIIVILVLVMVGCVFLCEL